MALALVQEPRLAPVLASAHAQVQALAQAPAQWRVSVNAERHATAFHPAVELACMYIAVAVRMITENRLCEHHRGPAC